jgi:hypothetical protein
MPGAFEERLRPATGAASGVIACPSLFRTHERSRMQALAAQYKKNAAAWCTL